MNTENKLLATLPKDVLERLNPFSRLIDLPHGQVLNRPGQIIDHLHFPVSCLISVTVTMSSGNTTEAGIVGSREMVGLNAFMGGRETSQTEYITQVPGSAIRISAEPFLVEFNHNKAVRDVMLRFTQAYIAQLSQNVACNRQHETLPRLARWLLECYWRLESKDLSLTHDFISQMLGVRRAGVSEGLGELKEAGAIEYSRKTIQVTDPARLQSEACECFDTLRMEYERLIEFN